MKLDKLYPDIKRKPLINSKTIDIDSIDELQSKEEILDRMLLSTRNKGDTNLNYSGAKQQRTRSYDFNKQQTMREMS